MCCDLTQVNHSAALLALLSASQCRPAFETKNNPSNRVTTGYPDIHLKTFIISLFLLITTSWLLSHVGCFLRQPADFSDFRISSLNVHIYVVFKYPCRNMVFNFFYIFKQNFFEYSKGREFTKSRNLFSSLFMIFLFPNCFIKKNQNLSQIRNSLHISTLD